MEIMMLCCTVVLLVVVIAVLAVRIMTHAETAQKNLRETARTDHLTLERLAEKINADAVTLASHSRERVPSGQKQSFPVQYTEPWLDPDATAEIGRSMTMGAPRPS